MSDGNSRALYFSSSQIDIKISKVKIGSKIYLSGVEVGTFPLQDKAGRSGYFQIVLVANPARAVKAKEGKEGKRIQTATGCAVLDYIHVGN